VGWREGMQENRVIHCTVAPSTLFISPPPLHHPFSRPITERKQNVSLASIFLGSLHYHSSHTHCLEFLAYNSYWRPKYKNLLNKLQNNYTFSGEK